MSPALIRRRNWRTSAAFLLPLALWGCAGAGGLAGGRAGVPAPRLEVGEKFQFSDGSSFRVLVVQGGSVTWETASGGQLRAPAEPMPLVNVPAGHASETLHVSGGDAPLWPLANGRQALFRASVERDGATRGEDVWSCRVSGPEAVRTGVGEFPAWKIDCDVLRGAERRAESVVAYYAPAIRWFARLEWRDGAGAPRVAELANLLTLDPPLPASATGRREAAMQAALESLPSGKDASWRDPASGVTGKVRPVRTFKAGNGRFCREFEEDTASAERFDRNRRLACRDPAGEWVEVENS